MIGLSLALAVTAQPTPCARPPAPRDAELAASDTLCFLHPSRPGGIIATKDLENWTISAAAPAHPVSTLARRLTLADARLKKGRAGWLTVRVYYRWQPGERSRLAFTPSQRLALWVNGYRAAYRDSSFAGPGGNAYVHAVSVPADVLQKHDGNVDMLLIAQVEARDGVTATLIVDRIEIACSFTACRL